MIFSFLVIFFFLADVFFGFSPSVSSFPEVVAGTARSPVNLKPMAKAKKKISAKKKKYHQKRKYHPTETPISL